MIEKGVYLPEADVSRKIYIKEDPLLSEVGHFHEGVELVAVMEGEIEAYHFLDKQVLRPGQIFFADSFECHYYKPLTPQIRAIVIVLSSDYTGVFREVHAGKTLPVYMMDREKNAELVAIMKQWLHEENKGFMLNVGYSNLLLSKLVERYEVKSRNEQKNQGVGVKLLTYVNDHYTEDISLTAVAKAIGYSKEYCSKTFAELVGMSFRDYLNLLRLRKAEEYFSMKNTTSLTTTEIVYKCGFNSTATFYRAKKALKGKKY